MSIDKLVKSYVQASIRSEPASKSTLSSPGDSFATSTFRSQITSTVRHDTESLGSRIGGRPQSYHFDSPSRGGSRTFEKIQAHINNVTSVSRPPSPLKNSVAPDTNTNDGTAIVKTHNTGSLVKVYGTVLSRPQTLRSFMCNASSMT